MAHVHGALHGEKGLLTSAGKEITNKGEIVALLQAFWLPNRLAIVHCKEHQEEDSSEAGGNTIADLATQEVEPSLLNAEVHPRAKLIY